MTEKFNTGFNSNEDDFDDELWGYYEVLQIQDIAFLMNVMNWLAQQLSEQFKITIESAFEWLWFLWKDENWIFDFEFVDEEWNSFPLQIKQVPLTKEQVKQLEEAEKAMKERQKSFRKLEKSLKKKSVVTVKELFEWTAETKEEEQNKRETLKTKKNKRWV